VTVAAAAWFTFFYYRRGAAAADVQPRWTSLPHAYSIIQNSIGLVEISKKLFFFSKQN